MKYDYSSISERVIDLKRMREETETPALDLRVMFYIFVATIPAESYKIFTDFSIPQLLGIVFIVFVGVRGRVLLQRPPAPIYYFLVYVGFIALSIQWSSPFFYGYWKDKLIQWGKLLFFYWVSSFLVKSPKILLGALYSFSYSLVLMLILAELKVPGFSVEMGEEVYHERSSLGLTDPNAMTFMVGIALLFFLYLIAEKYKKDKKLDKFHSLLGLFLIYIVNNLASRGGQIAIILSMIVFASFYVKRGYKTVVSVLIFLLILLLVIVSFTEHSSQRWKETIEEGKMSGREKIWPAAIDMIKREPLIGYGVGEHIYILGVITGKEKRDPHSTFLWVLLEVGLLGGGPFIIGFLSAGYYMFKKRFSKVGILSFSIYVLTLISNMNFTALYLKITWFVLAIVSSYQLRRDE